MMLLQFLYTLSGENLVPLAFILAGFSAFYLVLLFKAGVRVGIFGNLVSCLAGIVSPLTAAFAAGSGVFGFMFSIRFMIEASLIILAIAGMMKTGKKKPLGIIIILGNYLYFSIAGTMIPLGMQDAGYWIKTALAVGAFGIFILISDSTVITDPGSTSGMGGMIPGSGNYEYAPYGDYSINDGFTAYDRSTGRSFHHSLGEWYDQDGNLVPSASAHAWGLDDYYDKYIAGHDLAGRMPYDSK